MDELQFRVVGISSQRARDWPKLTQDRLDHSTILQRALLAWRKASSSARILIACSTIIGLNYALSAQPSAQDIFGKRVLVLLDTSGSMGNTTERTNQQLAALKAHNISVTEPFSNGGYAISAEHPTYSLLQPLQEALNKYADADTLYIISDFKGGDEDENDEAGYQMLLDLLRARHLTLYLCTVDHAPPRRQYYDLAATSGGAVIEEFKNPE